MGTVGLIWGISSFIGFSVGLIPCLGWLNWANIPFSVAGVVFNVVAMARASANHKTPGTAIAGLVLAVVAVGLGLIRLLLGGGVF